jgi:hypothetical protein
MTNDFKDSGLQAKKTHKSLDPVTQFPSFFANDHHAYIARKAERLSAAVHLVTGFIDAGEPLRTMLRAGALDVLEWCTDLQKLGVHGIDSLGARAAFIGSALSTAESSGLVSNMNARLIIDEYARLAVFVKDRYSVIRSQASQIDISASVPDINKGQKDIPIYRTQPRPVMSDMPSNQSGRRSDILSVLSNKDRISIKDVVSVIDGVSEKTIQRELIAMVADGVLIKEGERRWSTYRRASPDVKSELQ